MHQSLYRKYRPINFDEVVGQKVIIQTLKNAIKNNSLSHAYLFAGPRGTGKTSIAKILAKMVNCENLKNYNPCEKCVNCTQYNKKQSMDIIEIDAASNNGVEEIRELKNKINFVPSLGKYKIYIIDEVHMLSTGAFNALLKTLEEPPEHVIFILATTDPHKIPLTVLSRCQRFDFKKISNTEITKKLKEVVLKEKIEIEENALEEISYLADGGMRDALSILDQAIAYSSNQITLEEIHEINGTITPKEIKTFMQLLQNKNVDKMLQMIENFNINGKDFYKLCEEIILYLRNAIIYQTLNEKTNDYNLNLSIDIIMDYIKQFNITLYEMKTSNNMKLNFELLIIKLINNESKQLKETKNIEKIRINNTLCNFDKKEYLNFKSKFKKLFENSEEKLEKLISNGDIKAYSSNYFIILYDDKKQVDEFNNNYEEIDKILFDMFNDKIRGIAVDYDNWINIKENFNSKKIEYKYMEEEMNI